MKQIYFLLTLCTFLFANGLNAQTSHTVAMLDNIFEPADITINVGDTIVWVNEGNVIHTATSGTDCTYDGTWNSGNVSSGESFSHVFTEAGNNPYFCIPHCGIGMVGSVTIQQAMDVEEANLTSSDVTLSPNPARDQSTITINSAGLSNVHIDCYDLTGKKIELPYERMGNGSNTIAYDLRLTDLNKGIYFVQVTNKGEVVTTRRLLVQ